MNMRKSASSAMQKTYDDCYLVCSTAVYFENENNEAEALRSWKNALDQIYYHNAYRVPSNYRPKTETERALQESLRQMELQCKERVDLLEAIKQSRLDAEKEKAEGHSPKSGTPSQALTFPGAAPAVGSSRDGQGWLASGTIPPVVYSDLARPSPLPIRPSLPMRNESSSSDTITRSQSLPQDETQSSALTPYMSASRAGKNSRTPSPEKKSMLRTLRPAGKDRVGSSSSKAIITPKSRPGVPAAKAASQAWGTKTPNTARYSTVSAPTMTTSPYYNTSRDKPRKSETSLLAYRKEYPAVQINPRDAIDSARRKHGLGQRDRSPYTNAPQGSESDELSDYQGSNRPNESRRITNSKSGGVENDELSAALSPSIARRPVSGPSTPKKGNPPDNNRKHSQKPRRSQEILSTNTDDKRRRRRPPEISNKPLNSGDSSPTPASEAGSEPLLTDPEERAWKEKVQRMMKKLPKGVDENAAKQIFNEIVVHGDEVHWDDIAGLEVAKAALKETVVYPFLRPDLFMGLREPARGMLLFGPPGTGKTMLARAVATESKSTFFAISASSLTSKYLGESEKLVRALFVLAKALAPSIIFVDEIDSLLSSRGDSGEHEATRRIKTEFLIQWSDLARASAGREQSEKEKEKGDASRVLVLAATNLPWAIDEAARRRFVRRQYIPLPEDHVRALQLRTLLSHQKHNLTDKDITRLVRATESFSGSDITALAKDAAMGPLRSLGEKLLDMSMDDIRPIELQDFLASLQTIRPSVSKQGLKQYEEWAKEFGERGG